MRTSLNELKELEDYLFRYKHTPGASLTEARLILYPDWRDKLLWQKRTYALIEKYGRKQLRAEIESVHQRLFQEPEYESFRRKIFRLFTKH